MSKRDRIVALLIKTSDDQGVSNEVHESYCL